MKKGILSAPSSAILNLVIGLIIATASLIIVILVNQTMRQQALEEASAKARILLDRNMAVHAYFSQVLKPNIFAWSEPFRSEDYFDPSWMSSTYAVREIDKFFHEFSPADYEIRDAAINARSPQNEADEYERAFLEEIKNNPELERSGVRTIDGKPYLVVLRAGEVLDETCLRCHSEPELAPLDLVSIYGPETSFHREDEIGEVISAISIRIPLDTAYGEAGRFTLRLSGLLLLLLIVLFSVILWLQKTFVFAPLEKIRAKALQISTSVEYLGEKAPVPNFRDLADLANAFNAMSSSLRQNRDQLEERVLTRTSELAKANSLLEQENSERKKAEQSLIEYSDRLEDLVQERTQELVRTQEQLWQREKLTVLGQLAGGVAHELRNPLGAIKNTVYYLGLVLEEPNNEIKESLLTLNTQVEKSEQIIHSLLDFGQTRAPNKKMVDINDEIKKVLAQISLPKDPPIELVHQMDSALLINADKDHLAIIFGNLYKLRFNPCRMAAS